MNILFFAPYYSMWNTTLIENLFIEELSNHHKVNVLYCDGFMSNICIAQDSEHKDIFTSRIEKLKTCKKCKKNFKSLKKNTNINYIKIDEFITKEILKEITDLNLEEKSNIDLLNFDLNNINIGRLVLYELSLKKKKIKLSIEDDNERAEVIEKIKQILKFNYALTKISKSLQIELAFTSNGYYYINKFLIDYLKKKEINTYALNNSSNFKYSRTRLIISKENEINDNSLYLEKYKNFTKYPLFKSTIDDALESTVFHMKGSHSHVFSPEMKNNFDIKEKFKIKRNKKIILVVLSSQAEIFSSKNILSLNFPQTLFDNQIDFIKFLLDISNSLEDYHFILRTHPRQYLDSMAQEIIDFEKIKFENYPNVSVNTPKDKLSIFNFVKDIDFIINTWSSTAINLGVFGIENITIFPEFVFYPANCMNIIKKKEDLKSKLSDIKKRNISNSINFFKYLQYQENYSTINFDKNFKCLNFFPYLGSNLIEKIFFKYINFKIWKIIKKINLNKIDKEALEDLINKKNTSFAKSKLNTLIYNKYFDNKNLLIDENLLKEKINNFTFKNFNFKNFT